MRPRILKEIRLLLPAWVLTVVLTFIPSVFKGMGPDWAVMFLAPGCAMIAACSFGSEFSYGTLPSLLSQPIERRRMWFEKILTLIVMLLPIIIAALLIYFGTIQKPTYWMLLVIPICAVCSTPFYTFLTRSTVGAVVLSVGAPFLISLGGGALILWLLKIDPLSPDRPLDDYERRLHPYLLWYFAVALTSYCGVLYAVGYRSFQKLEVANMLDRQIRLGTFLHSAFEGFVNKILSGQRRYLAAVLGKELRLHQHTVTLWIIFTGIQVAAVAFILVAKPASPDSYFLLPLTIYSLLVPLAAGACAFAEEERLGVRACHLTLPLSVRKQWLIKLAVAFPLVAIFGTVVPLAWMLIARQMGSNRLPLGDETLLTLLVYQVLAFCITLYTSSFSRDTLRAMLAAIGCLAGLAMAGAVVGYTAGLLALKTHVLFGPILGRTADSLLEQSPWLILFFFGLLPVLGSLHNFRTLDRSPAKICRAALVIFSPGLLVIFLLVLVAHP